jgi:uncharacterized protein
MPPVEQAIVYTVLDEKYCVVKLPAGSPAPAIPIDGELFSVTKTEEEVSVVCEEMSAPVGAQVERNWRALKVQGPLEFELKGVLVSLLQPLADAKVSAFALSTYNTDYILVKQYHLNDALRALELAGHRLTQ